MRARVPPSHSPAHIEENSRDDSDRGCGDNDHVGDDNTAEGRELSWTNFLHTYHLAPPCLTHETSPELLITHAGGDDFFSFKCTVEKKNSRKRTTSPSKVEDWTEEVWGLWRGIGSLAFVNIGDGQEVHRA